MIDKWIEPEINRSSGGIMVVGRDPGGTETRLGRPFVGPAGELLESCLGTAGLRRKDVNTTNVVNRQPPGNQWLRHRPQDVERGLDELAELVTDLNPDLIVALGNEASFALVGESPLEVSWPGDADRRPFTATGIMDRRGFFHETGRILGNRRLDSVLPVLTTIHPASLLHGGGVHGINNVIGKVLLTRDLERAKNAATEGFRRPDRRVRIVTNNALAEAAEAELRTAGICAADIEIYDERTLQCIGFAARSDLAWVFPPEYFDTAFRIIEDPAIQLIYHNGQFDSYFLETRYGIESRGYNEDTIIQFHVCWPELAGADSKSGSGKRTQKSLRFLSSIYTQDRYWKDYTDNDHEMYQLNGMDCMVTLDVWKRLNQELEDLGIDRRIYDQEIGLVPVMNEILATGIRVDETARRSRRSQIVGRLGEKTCELIELATTALVDGRDRVENPDLFWKRRTCHCCRGGSGKRDLCWGCAGFEKSPSKKDLEARFGGQNGLKKAEIVAKYLEPCAVCGGAGSWESFEFNPRSSQQKIELLYNVLKLPKRYKDGKLTAEESKLKDLLGAIS